MKLKLTALLMALLLGGCNTMSGMGRDIERGGEKLQDKAQQQQRSN